jgi:hypothetical protein
MAKTAQTPDLGTNVDVVDDDTLLFCLTALAAADRGCSTNSPRPVKDMPERRVIACHRPHVPRQLQ